MATLRAAGTHIRQFSWPDQAAGRGVEPQGTGPGDWLGRARLVRARALAETSAAFDAGGSNVTIVCRELADRVAAVLGATALIRPLGGGMTDLPIAVSQAGGRRHHEVVKLVEADPHALAAACSARAAQMRGSILLPQVDAKALRLWSERSAWPWLDALGIGSMLVAAVCARRRAVGSIVVWRPRAGPPLQEDDRLFVEEVARRLAGAHRLQS